MGGVFKGIECRGHLPPVDCMDKESEKRGVRAEGGTPRFPSKQRTTLITFLPKAECFSAGIQRADLSVAY